VSPLPVVGICAAFERARWTVWDTEANVSPRTYSEKVAAADGLPFLLPPHDAIADRPEEVLDRLDALILAGGSDLDPASYGATAGPETIGFRPERDRFELALTRAAVERELPLLGVCRGMEILNVALGGTLDQHVAEASAHLRIAGAFSHHEVALEPGSLAARAAGGERVEVHSHHHQGIDELGEGLVVSGRAVPDDLVEAVELPEHPFALGILWHTEEEPHSTVIPALVEATRTREAVG
jgi:putative glutamine amidotransferase